MSFIHSSPEYWEQRASELSRTSLETVRASATAWATTTSTLMGIFGTVAIVKGPDAFSKLNGSGHDVTVALVIVAAVSSFISVLATAWASRGPTKRYAPLTGLTLSAWTKKRTGSARKALAVGEVTAVLAALLVVSAGITAIVTEAHQSSGSSDAFYLVRTTTGALQCGTLTRSGGKLLLIDDTDTVVLDLSAGVGDATAVASCPVVGRK